MKETVSNWVNNVGQFFSNLKINIVNKVAEIRDGIKINSKRHITE